MSMRKNVLVVMVFVSSWLFAQEGSQIPRTGGSETSYVEVSLGLGWPWDLGPSFRSRVLYGYMIDRALSFQGGY